MKSIFTTFLLGFSLAACADSQPLWLRHPAISPDGQTIAFTYKGDIFTVAAGGGEARQLTTHPAYDSYPGWSRDGRQIVFASTREGSMDIYLMDREGGTSRRLTTDSSEEIPMAFSDNTHVLFSADGMPTAKSILFASHSFPQTYIV